MNIADARRHGLKFIGEARVNDLNPSKFTPQVIERMRELEGAPEIVREQYKDFVQGTAFRETLLCHSELEIAPGLLIERVPRLYASCDATPMEDGRPPNGQATLFRQKGGAELETTHPLVCAALTSLGMHWPVAVSFAALLATARAAANPEAGRRAEVSEAEILADALISAYRAGFLELQVSPHEVTNGVSERPSVSRLARFLLAHGQSASNQLHVFMKFPDPLSRRLVQLLDGTRDREMLTSDLLEYVRSGQGQVLENGLPVEDMSEVGIILERRVREGLASLAREGMLVS
jgi:methyltransferase-like protein